MQRVQVGKVTTPPTLPIHGTTARGTDTPLLCNQRLIAGRPHVSHLKLPLESLARHLLNGSSPSPRSQSNSRSSSTTRRTATIPNCPPLNRPNSSSPSSDAGGNTWPVRLPPSLQHAALQTRDNESPRTEVAAFLNFAGKTDRYRPRSTRSRPGRFLGRYARRPRGHSLNLNLCAIRHNSRPLPSWRSIHICSATTPTTTTPAAATFPASASDSCATPRQFCFPPTAAVDRYPSGPTSSFRSRRVRQQQCCLCITTSSESTVDDDDANAARSGGSWRRRQWQFETDFVLGGERSFAVRQAAAEATTTASFPSSSASTLHCRFSQTICCLLRRSSSSPCGSPTTTTTTGGGSGGQVLFINRRR